MDLKEQKKFDIVYILGANSFVAKNISEGLKTCSNKIFPLTRKDFELGNEVDYSKYNFSNSLIIDCITRIDGSELEIIENNLEKFKEFIIYLKLRHKDFRYIYFSTLSVSSKQAAQNNPYIKSKSLAEQFLNENLSDYLVIRLSFPFGKGESSKRLISRLIQKIKSGEILGIDNLSLSLMPVENLRNDICDLISFKGPVVQYLNARIVTLESVVKFIYSQLKIKENYQLRNSIPTAIQADPLIIKLEKNIDPFPAIESMI
ncbi:MAG: hypothetical protein C5B52_09485 [Bacteroidetes bacterium]|nr:MAG: hypothetical protein C5B52_09485 [Bacteroidota bacterium]